MDAVRQGRFDRREDGADLGVGFDDVGARDRIDDDADRGLAVIEADIADVLIAVDHVGDVAQQHRRVVAIGDDEILVIRRRARLVVGADLVALLALVDGAFGAVGVGGGRGGADILHADAVTVQFVGLQLDSHRRQGAAAQGDLAHALDLRHLLLEHRVGAVVELGRGQGVRRQRQDHDRRVGRVVLPPGRIAPQRGRQIGAGRLDRRLDVARGAVDVAGDVELGDDAGRADIGGRGQFGDAGDGGHALFQRLGDGGGHDLGRGAGQVCLDHHHREGDVGQRRHRQIDIGQNARQQDRDGQQGRRDRPVDEKRREVHEVLPVSAGGVRRAPPKRSDRRSKAR